jgi:hypothetical protein
VLASLVVARRKPDFELILDRSQPGNRLAFFVFASRNCGSLAFVRRTRQ